MRNYETYFLNWQNTLTQTRWITEKKMGTFCVIGSVFLRINGGTQFEYWRMDIP